MSLLEFFDKKNGYNKEESKDTFKPFPNTGTLVNIVSNYLIYSSCLAYNTLTEEYLSVSTTTQELFHRKASLHFSGVQGVCNIVDVKTLGDTTYVFRPQTYGDLHFYLREKKRLPEAQAAPLFRQIVTMVADAHSKMIALRDIKLKKFVFTEESRTSLALVHLDDAQFMDSSGMLTDKHGCPAYICPEKLQSDSYSGKAADLWSLGVILYTLLVGNYPFFDSTPQELFSKVRTGFYQVPEHVSYLARNLISSLLTYEPSQRLSASAALEHPWFRLAPSEQLPRAPSAYYGCSDQIVPE